jgi:hypothetical protein
MGSPNPPLILEYLRSTLVGFQEFFLSFADDSICQTRSQYEFYFSYGTANLADSKEQQLNLSII